MADITDFEVGQGETFKIYAQIFNQSTNSNVDISIFDFSGQVRENYTTTEKAADFTITKVEPTTSGSIFIELSSQQTELLDQRSYVYDIEMTRVGSNPPVVRRILEGGLTVRPGVTR